MVAAAFADSSSAARPGQQPRGPFGGEGVRAELRRARWRGPASGRRRRRPVPEPTVESARSATRRARGGGAPAGGRSRRPTTRRGRALPRHRAVADERGGGVGVVVEVERTARVSRGRSRGRPRPAVAATTRVRRTAGRNCRAATDPVQQEQRGAGTGFDDVRHDARPRRTARTHRGRGCRPCGRGPAWTAGPRCPTGRRGRARGARPCTARCPRRSGRRSEVYSHTSPAGSAK